MPSTAKVAIGVRLPRKQVETIRLLAGGELSMSDVVRRLIAVGLEHNRKENRCSDDTTAR